ncbi:uncharacterized protein LOC128205554 [Mya arenaria]|uniref:uncharacterized protein LOC128205554 n=1 Tax=Mya arenaria TaxID=6604 RepID=UPI0022E94AD3|nr:uncharacterized protein LOC128205554 [Mya arenaria]
MRENIPLMEVTFAEGRQFTNRLRVLSLDNVTLNETLNIQQCDKLQKLWLDTLTFSDDFRLDVSSFTHLSNVVLQHLKLRQVTIDPTQLEQFWVSIYANMRENIPLMEVTFAEGRQFTNRLRVLSLDNVTLNETLNIQQCDKLQELQLNTLTFSDNFHLDLSSFTALTMLSLTNHRRQHETFLTVPRKEFWVSIKKYMRENIPPTEVIFTQKGQFTNKLRELRLYNATLNENLNIQQCDKLQQLRLGKFLYPEDGNQDLSFSCTDLTVVTLQNLSLHHLIIIPTQLEKSWVLVSNNLSKMIPHIQEALQSDGQITNISQIYRSEGFAYIS